jgi:uncharacterized protein
MINKPLALITGASEGLGKYLALECAQRNINLVLVALPGSKLHNLAHYITYNYGVQVWAFEKDLCAEGSCTEIYDAVKAQGLTISMLINNAGMGCTKYFDECDMTLYDQMIYLNIMTTTTLTHLFLNDLKQSNPAFLLNVGSLAGLMPTDRKSVYSSSKAYVITFSKILRSELKQHNVSVSVLCPGGMNTSWQRTVQHRIVGAWLFRNSILDPCDVARITLTQLLAGKAMIIPGWWNQFFLACNRALPKWFINHYTSKAMRNAPPEIEIGQRKEPELQQAAVA